jgi:hypothetical protein
VPKSSLQAHCSQCQKTVTAFFLSNPDGTVPSLDKGKDVRVMHPAAGGSHSWSLSEDDKANLRWAIAQGVV